ncbi:hypothetical protein M413DRAFT_329932 [Hebeloma cylindrosporum]|uniref:Rho-GAP domain-containing protein n=1 Tax=Hebeloma cylindrosporum TaxID=76867 RepID=A0A0C2YVW5_HEBCY|nr:hypothetical protein M413DRAFT_329932 [Hebeloma cylindrosporum h7]
MPPASFNLKQKLAALSLGPSSPYGPSTANTRDAHGNGHESYPRSPTSPNTRRKAFFNSSGWGKKPRGHNVEIPVGEEEKRMVQDVLTRMIFQAGVDFETRPMVVLNASALPDPQVVSYDLLLARILSYLHLYVEADYTIIFFAAGSKHAPSWNWVWKAYRSLNRKYRKNLKQLYIVHSSFFSKMLFSLAGAIISPKFFRKITYITTLSELAEHIPLTQIDIPPAVYQENLKYERKITLPVPTRSSVFGVPLEDLMGYDGEKGGIPRVVRDAIQYLRDRGLHEDGLFRRSPLSTLLRAAQEAYDRGNVVSLETFSDPHLAAVLLKKYLRDLPEPIFPESMYGTITRCPMPPSLNDLEGEMASVQYIRETLLPELVPCAYILLSQIMHLLHDVSLRSETNRMDAFNLAIVICPNLVKSSNPMRDVMMSTVPVPSMSTPSRTTSTATLAQLQSPHPLSEGEGKTTLGIVIALCIRRYYEIFDEVVDRHEPVAPWRALRSHGWGADGASSASGSPGQPTYVLGDGDDEDDIDDEMLVMSVGIENKLQLHPSTSSGPPSAWGSIPQPHWTKRHKSTPSNGNDARSIDNDYSPSSSAHNGPLRSSHPHTGNNKARSMVSVEGSGHSGAYGSGGTRRGSITIGRSTTRKGSGAAVEAVSVVAVGFFTPPANGPTTPNLLEEQDKSTPEEEEGKVLTVGERRRMFERGT